MELTVKKMSKTKTNEKRDRARMTTIREDRVEREREGRGKQMREKGKGNGCRGIWKWQYLWISLFNTNLSNILILKIEEMK